GESIVGMVEKPNPEEAPSDLAVVGKFIMTPEILKELRDVKPSSDGEIRLTSALESFIKSGGDLRGKILEGTRFDTGDKLGFLKATLHFATKKEGDRVTETIQDFLSEKK
ncbi:MAG: UTP--glucose-1-phosphate uridylyltransferase, partial [Candidatus Peregrinibacteria bacterium]|nr:UTP--glucose-1-phosphate uridylyltransferase [Candidatus Peregrinibacteria bacterium]